MKEKIIKGQLHAARIFESQHANKIEVELGLVTGLGKFIVTNDNSFSAHWLPDLLHVLNQVRLELNNESKYKKIISHNTNTGTVVQYEFK